MSLPSSSSSHSSSLCSAAFRCSSAILKSATGTVMRSLARRHRVAFVLIHSRTSLQVCSATQSTRWAVRYACETLSHTTRRQCSTVTIGTYSIQSASRCRLGKSWSAHSAVSLLVRMKRELRTMGSRSLSCLFADRDPSIESMFA